MSWIDKMTVLSGETVELMPLQAEHYFTLKQIAENKRIWEFYPLDLSDPGKFSQAINMAIAEKENGTQMPFIIFHKRDQKIVGSTRLIDIHAAHKKLEIGWTWLEPDYWATDTNLECKLLLLTFCFEALGAVRVQLKTDENNLRSRKAILKTGAQYEGILRHDMLRDNGTYRNTAYFSILDKEWDEVKINLTAQYNRKHFELVKNK